MMLDIEFNNKMRKSVLKKRPLEKHIQTMLKQGKKAQINPYVKKVKKKKANLTVKPRKSMNIKQSQQLKALFDTTLDRVFQMLDIFNKGSISEVNINRWVPEPVFYFLGGVFQNIKQTRKTLTKLQFFSQCQKIFQSSTADDVRWFIEELKQIKTMNDERVSNNDSEQEKEDLIEKSYVEDRIPVPYPDGQTSFRKISNHNKVISFNQLIEAKENNIQQKSKSYSQNKKKAPSPLTQIDPCNIPLQQKPKQIIKQKIALTPQHQEKPLQEKCLVQHSIPCSPQFKNFQEVQKLQKNVQPDTDRIEELSAKLESYIRQNSVRLEKSKNFRIDAL